MQNALPARRAARRGRQLGQRERRHRQPRARGRRPHAGRRGDGRGRARGAGRRRLHRRDRRADADGRRARAACSPPARRSTPDGDAGFWRAIATTDAFEKRLTLDVALPSGGTVRVSAQAKGAGMIQPQLRDDALLRADRRGAAGRDRRPAARRLRQALLRPHLRRRPALHERHGDPHGLGRERRRRRPGDAPTSCALGEALDYALPPARAADGPRRRGRRARSAACTSAAATRRPSSASPAPSPTRRWSRPRSTAATRTGAASSRPSAPRCPGAAPLPVDVHIQGVQVCAGGVAVPHDAAALADGGAPATRSTTRSGLPGEGAETEVFFSDLSHDYVRINAEYTT